jgi:hypothetical protein
VVTGGSTSIIGQGSILDQGLWFYVRLDLVAFRVRSRVLDLVAFRIRSRVLGLGYCSVLDLGYWI